VADSGVRDDDMRKGSDNGKQRRSLIEATRVLEWITINVSMDQLIDDADEGTPEEDLPMAAALWFIAMAEAEAVHALPTKEVAVYLTTDDGFPTYTTMADLQAWLDDYVEQQLTERKDLTRGPLARQVLWDELAARMTKFFSEEYEDERPAHSGTA
jgi:hypothetical protein